jgi:hypothetical protein
MNNVTTAYAGHVLKFHLSKLKNKLPCKSSEQLLEQINKGNKFGRRLQSQAQRTKHQQSVNIKAEVHERLIKKLIAEFVGKYRVL